MGWNPFSRYLRLRERQIEAAERASEVERLQRAEERELFRTAILSMTQMVSHAFEANRAQNDAFKVFLEGFKVTDPPKIREYDEAEDSKRYLESKKPASYEDWEKLVEKMETFGLD